MVTAPSFTKHKSECGDVSTKQGNCNVDDKKGRNFIGFYLSGQGGSNHY